MKKALFILALLAAGCSGRDQYSIEKEYWKLTRLSEQIASNPAAIPPTEIERTVKLFAGFSVRHPRTSLAVSADFAIAKIYLAKDNADMARRQLEAVAKKYDSPEIKAEACFLTGTTYQEDDWEMASACFARVLRDYPLTKRGLGVPVYMAEYYRNHFEPDKMVAQYNEAVEHYRVLAARFPGTPLALEVRLMAASCYGGLKEWKNSVQTLESVVEEFRTKAQMDTVLMNIALIYRKELNDPVRYRETLGRMVKEYPGSPLISTVKGLLRTAENDEKRAGK
jgi:outer membrane protein assembly factor BamD (BamD/ComL family)